MTYFILFQATHYDEFNSASADTLVTLESASEFIADMKQLLTKKAYADFKAMLNKTTISEIYYYLLFFSVT